MTTHEIPIQDRLINAEDAAEKAAAEAALQQTSLPKANHSAKTGLPPMPLTPSPEVDPARPSQPQDPQAMEPASTAQQAPPTAPAHDDDDAHSDTSSPLPGLYGDTSSSSGSSCSDSPEPSTPASPSFHPMDNNKAESKTMPGFHRGSTLAQRHPLPAWVSNVEEHNPSTADYPTMDYSPEFWNPSDRPVVVFNPHNLPDSSQGDASFYYLAFPVDNHLEPYERTCRRLAHCNRLLPGLRGDWDLHVDFSAAEKSTLMVKVHSDKEEWATFQSCYQMYRYPFQPRETQYGTDPVLTPSPDNFDLLPVDRRWDIAQTCLEEASTATAYYATKRTAKQLRQRLVEECSRPVPLGFKFMDQGWDPQTWKWQAVELARQAHRNSYEYTAPSYPTIFGHPGFHEYPTLGYLSSLDSTAILSSEKSLQIDQVIDVVEGYYWTNAYGTVRNDESRHGFPLRPLQDTMAKLLPKASAEATLSANWLMNMNKFTFFQLSQEQKILWWTSVRFWAYKHQLLSLDASSPVSLRFPMDVPEVSLHDNILQADGMDDEDISQYGNILQADGMDDDELEEDDSKHPSPNSSPSASLDPASPPPIPSGQAGDPLSSSSDELLCLCGRPISPSQEFSDPETAETMRPITIARKRMATIRSSLFRPRRACSRDPCNVHTDRTIPQEEVTTICS